MKQVILSSIIMTILVLALATFVIAAVPQTISYQGRLTDASGTVTDIVSMTFTIYDAETNGNSKWSETHSTVQVVDGIFNVVLGAGTPAVPIDDTVFSGQDRWLEISVGGEIITPRTKLASNPYAFQSNWNRVGDVLYTSGGWGIARAGNTLYGNGSNSHVNLGSFNTTGQSGQNRYHCTVGGGLANSASGAYSAVGGGENNTASGDSSTVAGGSRNHAIGVAATVGGGFADTANGYNSTVSGGQYNVAVGDGSTAGGGWHNTAEGHGSTVAGGQGNTAGQDWGTIGGGSGNTASGLKSTVGGGSGNTAGGVYSTVPGGELCAASGRYSFAAGRRAKANHDGSFVWADSTDADFSSTGGNQFLIRADGGVGINTNDPGAALKAVASSGNFGYLGGSVGAQGEHSNGNAGQLGTSDAGVWGHAATSSDYAGLFDGDVHASGDITADGNCCSSDERYKKNIKALESSLEKVLSLRGINYLWKSDEFPGHRFDDGNQIGFIAQEIKKVLPEVVHKGKDGYYSIDYGKVTPLLVEAIKELKTENDELKAQIAQLTALVETVLANQQKANGSGKLASSR